MIFFDLAAAQPLGGGQHGGGEYARSVFMRLVESNLGPRLLCLVDSRRVLPQELEGTLREQRIQVRSFGSKTDLQSILSSGEADRIYSALPYEHDTLDFTGLDVIFTVHGLRPVEMPTDRLELLYAKTGMSAMKWMAKQLFTGAYRSMHMRKIQRLASVRSRSMMIVVPSEHTRAALTSLPGLAEDLDVIVLYSPPTRLTSNARQDSGILSSLGLRKRKYLLIVSGDRWIKNSYRALMAIDMFDRTTREVGDFDIVVTGGLPHCLRGRLVRRLKALPYVHEEQLRALYAGAFALVYPTLNEGFGYPPLEAMACGTPVLASEVCSLPEICGDAVMYFDPYSKAAIANRLREMLVDNRTWDEYRDRGRDRYQLVHDRQEKDLDRLCEIIAGHRRE